GWHEERAWSRRSRWPGRSAGAEGGSMSERRKPLPVENCRRWFKFLCPRTWSQLERTPQLEVRYCPSCRRYVYYCEPLGRLRCIGGGARTLAARERAGAQARTSPAAT